MPAFSVKNAVFWLMIVLSALAGCSYTVTPGYLPAVSGKDSLSLAGVAVLIRNDQKDDAQYDILTSGGSKSGFKTNRRDWSGKLVESLAKELATRGAGVRSDAPAIIGITVPWITFTETRDVVKFRAKAVATAASGWKKEYEGEAGETVTSIASLSKEADRMAAQALTRIVQTMLDDPDFIAQIQKPR